MHAAGARALGVRASGRPSYTLSDAAVDGEKTEADQERATVLLLAEDALVHGVGLAAAGRLSLEALEYMLGLAIVCELDIARASPLNERGAQPLQRHLEYAGDVEPAATLAAKLKEYIEWANTKPGEAAQSRETAENAK